MVCVFVRERETERERERERESERQSQDGYDHVAWLFKMADMGMPHHRMVSGGGWTMAEQSMLT